MDSANTSPEKIAVEALQISMMALGYLKRMQINTIADLLDYTQEDLITLDEDCGREVIQALQTHFHLTLPLNDVDER